MTNRVKLAWLLVLGCFIVFSLTLSADMSLDAYSANFAAWHLATHGQPWIQDAAFLTDHPLRSVWVTQAGGNEVVSRSAGVIVFSLPAYWITQPAEMTSVPAGLTAALLTAGAVALMFLSLSTRLSRSWSLTVSLVFAFGTPVWAVAADTMWPHTITVFGIAGMAWAASKDKWWLVGLFGGIALTGRLHTALIVAIVGAGVAMARKRPDIVVKAAIPSAMILGLTMVWNHWLYGSWNVTGAYAIDGSTDLTARYPSLLTNQLGLFFALDRGIFVWTPVLLIVIPAVVRSWSSLPDWSRWLAGSGFVYTIVQGYVNPFHGGDTFWAYRLGLEFVACATPVVAFSLAKLGRVGWATVVPLAVGQVIVIGMGSTLNFYGMAMDEAWQRNIVLSAVAEAPVLGFILLAPVCLVSVLLHRAYRASRTPHVSP